MWEMPVIAGRACCAEANATERIRHAVKAMLRTMRAGRRGVMLPRYYHKNSRYEVMRFHKDDEQTWMGHVECAAVLYEAQLYCVISAWRYVKNSYELH